LSTSKLQAQNKVHQAPPSSFLSELIVPVSVVSEQVRSNNLVVQSKGKTGSHEKFNNHGRGLESHLGRTKRVAAVADKGTECQHCSSPSTGTRAAATTHKGAVAID